MQVTLETHLEEGNALSKEQKNYVKMVKICFKKYKLDLTDQKLYRYDTEKFNADYILSDEEKDLSEGKLKSELKKKKRRLKLHFDNQMKIVIRTEIEDVKQIVFTSYIPPSSIQVVENVLTLFYPHKLNSNVIWGRYSKKEKHGGGDLYFAPTEFDLIEFIKNRGENLVSDSFIKSFANIEENELLASNEHSVCNLLCRIRYSKPLNEELELFYENYNKEDTGNKLIDALNADKSLNKTFQRFITTFGNKTLFNKASFRSKTDINLLAFNYKSGAIIQLSTFHSTINNLMRVLIELISTLNNLTGKL